MASEDIFASELSEEQELAEDELNDKTLLPEDVDVNEDCDENGAKTAEIDASNNNNEKSDAIKATPSNEHEAKLTQLPMARIRNIMKLDPDLQVASNEAVFIVAKAVELFVASLARESYSYTSQAKKKTIQKRDVELAISAVDSLLFLDGVSI